MANRLIHETSPYLLQHAENPVDWYPWGEEAFTAAREQDKPILLSVGYSACHWCHVMERESFQDDAVAKVMNDHFINVKVDREERPDVDELYLRAVQLFNDGRGGGWPMTVFLTPEGEPFQGGTYYPPEPRHGLPSFSELLASVQGMWSEQRDHVQTITSQSVEHLDRTGKMPPRAAVLSREWLEPIVREAERAFDTIDGGFGGKPKFPPHNTLAVLLAHHHRTGESLSIDMATTTLDAMAKGGMYDVLAGGFARYSVDEEWRVPHFEKMLYDNAQLIVAYLDAFRLTDNPAYERVVRETVGWVQREMTLPHGGFAASQDADSEGGEGSFFVWTPAQLTEVLGDDGAAVAELLQVTEDGTFEEGASVLRLEVPREDLTPVEQQQLDEALPKLFEARGARPAPHRDDKVVASWNGLMVSALAKAGAALGEPDWVAAASRAMELLTGASVVDGRLMRTYKDDQARVPAYADDHVMLVAGCLDLWEATFEPAWLDQALEWMERTLELFWDDTQGGLLYSGHDQPPLVSTSSNFFGGAEPGANGVAALCLIRLGRMCGRDTFLEKAGQIVRAAQAMLGQAPRALGAEALAGAWIADGGVEVAIVGDPEHESTQELLAEMRRHHLPFAVQFSGVAPDEERMPWLEGKAAIDDQPTAYVCEGYTCGLPVHDVAGLSAQLEEARIRLPSPAAPVESRQAAPPLPERPEAWLGTEEALSLESLKGKVVLLDFWTSSCVNCLHVLPELVALQARFEGAPVQVIGVHSSKFTHEIEPDTVRVAMDRLGIEHPVVMDGNRAVWNAYGVRSWPTLVVLDAEGRVAAQRSGEVGVAELADVVEVLLEEMGHQSSDDPTELETVESPAPGQSLRFVGKVHVWPDAWEQEMGARLGSHARVYISDSGHHRIIEARVSQAGNLWPSLTVTRVFGSGEPGLVDGPAEEARFRNPQGVRRHGDLLYVADTDNHALRCVDLASGEVTTLAGNGRKGTAPPTLDQMREPTTLQLRSPWAVEVMAFRSHHIVFVAMAGTHQVYVYGAGHLGIHAGSGREDHVDGPAAVAALAQPSDLALYGRYLLFVDTEVSSVRAVDLQSHQLVTVVGRGLFDFGDVDGPSDRARLQHPLGLTFAGESVYVADTYNHKVRAVGLADGATSTLAGGADQEVFNEPSGIARLGQHLLVADSANHRVRAVSIQGGQVKDVPIAWD